MRCGDVALFRNTPSDIIDVILSSCIKRKGHFCVFQMVVNAYDLGTPSLQNARNMTFEMNIRRNTLPTCTAPTAAVSVPQNAQTNHLVTTMPWSDPDTKVSHLLYTWSLIIMTRYE